MMTVLTPLVSVHSRRAGAAGWADRTSAEHDHHEGISQSSAGRILGFKSCVSGLACRNIPIFCCRQHMHVTMSCLHMLLIIPKRPFRVICDHVLPAHAANYPLEAIFRQHLPALPETKWFPGC